MSHTLRVGNHREPSNCDMLTIQLGAYQMSFAIRIGTELG